MKAIEEEPMNPFQMIGVAEVAKLLDCSERKVYRMVENDEIPKPVKLGKLNRWQLQIILNWIEAGCTPN